MLLDRTRPARRFRDAGYAVADQIATLAGPGLAVALKREKPWASVTFSGTRHYIEIRADDGQSEQISRAILGILARDLPDHEFDLPSRFVADLLVRDDQSSAACLVIEILTIIDPVCDPAP